MGVLWNLIPISIRLPATLLVAGLLTGGVVVGLVSLHHQIYAQGYSAATARDAAASAAQEKKLADIQHQTELDWMHAADAQSLKAKDYSNVIQQTDALTAADPRGSDVALPDGPGLQHLRNIR